MQERIGHRYSCGAQVIPGLLKHGDVPEIGSVIAPRPCAWGGRLGGRVIDERWAERGLDRVRRAYRAHGAERRLHVDRFEGGHRWSERVACPLLDRVRRSA